MITFRVCLPWGGHQWRTRTGEKTLLSVEFQKPVRDLVTQVTGIAPTWLVGVASMHGGNYRTTTLEYLRVNEAACK